MRSLQNGAGKEPLWLCAGSSRQRDGTTLPLPTSPAIQVANIYLVAAGISRKDASTTSAVSSTASAPGAVASHAQVLACFCLDAIDVLREDLHSAGLEPVSAKIGLHTGPLTAGLIGHSRCYYRIFGDTVNVSSRMMSTGEVRRRDGAPAQPAADCACGCMIGRPLL